MRAPSPKATRSPADRCARPRSPTGYFWRTRLRRKPLHSQHDRLERPRPRRPPRRHRGGDPARRRRPRPVHDRRVRDDPLPPGLDGSTGPRGKRMRPLLGLLAYASIAGEHTPRAAGRRGGRAGPQLQPRPRRHRGRRRRAAPPADAVVAPRRAPGDQHRRPDLQPVAGRPPPADRPRVPRPDGPPAHAPVRRDVRDAVRGPVHRHRDVRLGRADDGRAVLRHDRAQDGGPDLGLDRGRRAARDRRRRGHRALPAVRLGARARVPAQRRPARHLGPGAPTGKVPTDIARHKKTLPVLYAFEHATPRGPRPADGAVRLATSRPRPRSPRSSRSSSGPAPASSPASEAQRWRDECFGELDGLEAVDPAAREQLRGIIASVISA